MNTSIKNMDFDPELWFNMSRSSGPGGQHVNKSNTRVELRFALWESNLLTKEQKELIARKLKNHINKVGILIIANQESRSQHQNKENCINRFYTLIQKALEQPKKRKPTRPTKASKKKRLENKRKQSEKKSLRKPPEI